MGPLSYFTLALVGFLIAGPFPRGARALSCPSGWMFYQDSCYGLFQDRMTWAEAEIDCQSQGRNAHLASIGSRAEAAVLAKHIQTYQQECINVWIGLHDPQRNRRWRWSDRSLANFRSWKAGEPNNNHEDGEYCVELWCESGYINWNDKNCRTENTYVCKYEL